MLVVFQRERKFNFKLVLTLKHKQLNKLSHVLGTSNCIDHSRVGDVAFPELSKHHYAALNDKGHFRFPECVVRGASGSFFRHAISVYSNQTPYAAVILMCIKVHSTPTRGILDMRGFGFIRSYF